MLNVIEAFQSLTGRSVPYELTERRLGDTAIAVADTELANNHLGWRAKRGLENMCSDSWTWHNTNPNGYVP